MGIFKYLEPTIKQNRYRLNYFERKYFHWFPIILVIFAIAISQLLGRTLFNNRYLEIIIFLVMFIIGIYLLFYRYFIYIVKKYNLRVVDAKGNSPPSEELAIINEQLGRG